MIDFLQSFFGPYYQVFRFIHIVAVMIWLFSTSVAYSYYLVPIFKSWRRNPHDDPTREMRNWVMERFDHGAILEHVAFPVIMLTGPLLYVLSGYDTGDDWMAMKLLIVFGLFLPIEIFDYTISHFRGAKKNIRAGGDEEDYERYMALHWNFFVYITVPISMLGLFVVFLAVVKPGLG